MEPLIELPDPARARIRAREAEAAQSFNSVVRACEKGISQGLATFGAATLIFTKTNYATPSGRQVPVLRKQDF